MNYKKIALRIGVTFVEAIVPFMALNHWDFTNRTVLMGGGSVGLSAVWNLVVYPMIQPYLSNK